MDLFTPAELAEHLHVSVPALAAMRHKGTGPRYTKVGRKVLYRPSDVEAWLESNLHDRTDRKVSA